MFIFLYRRPAGNYQPAQLKPPRDPQLLELESELAPADELKEATCDIFL
jgi:hypothetical protein